MKLDLALIDYLVILGFLGLVLAIKFFIKGQAKGLDSYFLASRKLTLPMFVATLVSTWYGNILGVAEIAFKHGIVNWLSQGIFWYLVYLFFAFFLAEKIHKSKLLSIPDQLEKYYGKSTAMLGALVNLIMLTPAPYILSMGLIFHLIFSIDTKLGIILGAVIPLIYILSGGFRAVVYTDMIQFLFMFVGLALVLPFALMKYGGFAIFENTVPDSYFSLTGDWSWQMILAWFLIAFWTLVDPGFYQRTYAAKDAKTARNGILLATLFWLVFDLMLTFSAIYAFAVMPTVDPKLSLPLLANDVLPVFFKGVFFTGLIATVMSTLDSLTFSSAMALSYDFFGRWFKLSDKKILKLNQLILVLVIVFGLVIALYFESLFKLIYIRGSLAIAALLIPLLMGILLKPKKSTQAGFCSLLTGFSTSMIWFLQDEFHLLPELQIFQVEPIFIGLISSFVVYLNFLNFGDAAPKSSREEYQS